MKKFKIIIITILIALSYPSYGLYASASDEDSHAGLITKHAKIQLHEFRTETIRIFSELLEDPIDGKQRAKNFLAKHFPKPEAAREFTSQFAEATIMIEELTRIIVKDINSESIPTEVAQTEIVPIEIVLAECPLKTEGYRLVKYPFIVDAYFAYIPVPQEALDGLKTLLRHYGYLATSPDLFFKYGNTLYKYYQIIKSKLKEAFTAQYFAVRALATRPGCESPVSFNLSGNSLIITPPEIFELLSVKKLDLSNNQLYFWPDHFTSFDDSKGKTIYAHRQYDNLNVSHNCLRAEILAVIGGYLGVPKEGLICEEQSNDYTEIENLRITRDSFQRDVRYSYSTVCAHPEATLDDFLREACKYYDDAKAQDNLLTSIIAEDLFFKLFNRDDLPKTYDNYMTYANVCLFVAHLSKDVKEKIKYNGRARKILSLMKTNFPERIAAASSAEPQ